MLMLHYCVCAQNRALFFDMFNIQAYLSYRQTHVLPFSCKPDPVCKKISLEEKNL